MISSFPFLRGGKQLDDRFSPILVKELRQGMRARAFVISFLLLQVFLVTLVLGNLAAQENRNVLDTQGYYFWVIVGFALLFLMPFRGLVAISQEVRHNTLETIMLTRMTAWRVVFGKWSALFAQSLLFVTAVLPYVVLRYFIGGEDVVSDFEALFFMLWLSGVMCAASIAISALGNLVVRIILIVAAVPTTISVLEGDFRSSSFSAADFWEIIGWLAIYGFFIPALLFELAASSIAPVSENHAVRRRGFALFFFLFSLLLGWVCGDVSDAGVGIALTVLIGICYYELSEKYRLLPRLVESVDRFGSMGRVFGIFLLPGWPSALLFSLVVLPLALSIHSLLAPDVYTPLDGRALPLAICSIFGSILVPIAICHLLWRRMSQVFLMVALYNIALLGLASLLEGFANLTQSKVDQVLDFIPGLPVLLARSVNDSHKDDLAMTMTGNMIVTVLLLIILLTASRAYFRGLFTQLRLADKTKTAAGNPGPQAPNQ